MAGQLLDALAMFVALLALGAHAWVPGRLAGAGAQTSRAVWARAALPLLLSMALLALARIRLFPDPFVGAGLLPVGPSPVTTAALVSFGTLLLADLFLALFHSRLEAAGWWLLVAVGGLALVAWSACEEAARIGSGPPASLEGYLAAVGLRAGVGLAAGALVFSRRGSRLDSRLDRTFGLLAALAAGGLWWSLPPIVQGTLAAGGDPLTLVAGALLLAGAPWLPARFQRITAVFGAALVALFLARAGSASEQIGQAGRVPPPLP